MPQFEQFRLPDAGEGLTEADIVEWRVAVGDRVSVNQPIVEIETAKSLVELPCPYAGTVTELLASEGQTVPVGTPIIRVADGAAAAEEEPSEKASGQATSEQGAAKAEEPTAMLVGYGPRAGAVRRRRRRGVPAHAAAGEASPPLANASPTSTAAPTAEVPAPRAEGPVRAKPPVRKLAKDLGIDLREVRPSGGDGVITRADVEAYAAARAQAVAAAPEAVAAAPTPAWTPERGERETRIPIRGVRRATAEAVTRSAFTAPHVTEWVTVDASATVELVARLRERREFASVKLTPLAVVAKACLLALRRTPELNATWDEAAGEIVLKHYVNLGIAAATPRGLTVPNIKDADRLSLPDLARAISELATTAREGKTPPADMQGTTFTITNVGVFGVDGGTPILNPGESGILAFGAIRKQPWVVDDEVVPRWVTTLALSFDHRVVDGEQGSRFLTDVAGIIEDPANALLLA